MLLHAWIEWEEGALDQFDGMFALAIWNDERGELTFGSDPFGDKPVFWAWHRERFVFGSDVRAMAEVPAGVTEPTTPRPGRSSRSGLLPATGATFFSGVHRVPGGHVLSMRDGRVRSRGYWAPRRIDVPVAYDDAVARLR